MVFDQLKGYFDSVLSLLNPVLGERATNFFTAFAILLVGVFVGKLTKWLLKVVLIKNLKLHLLLKHGLLESLLSLIKWIIYIVFLQTAIVELQIPTLSNWMGEGLYVIPSLVASLLILILGYAIGMSLKRHAEKIEEKGWESLGTLFFLFFTYISVITALGVFFNTVLVLQQETIGTIVVVITALWGATIAWNYKDAYGQVRKR